MKYSIRVSALAAASLLVASCASVKRVASDTVTDLSGYWNDTDVRLAAEAIVDGCLSSPRITGYAASHGGKLPVVIVGSYRNKSDEHIDTEILTKKLESALINSGKIEFVASSSERDEIRQERKDQQMNASEKTAKALGNETGADFMLKGAVKTIVDSNGKVMTRTYFIDTELINIETNSKIWLDSNSDIKKIIKRPAARF